MMCSWISRVPLTFAFVALSLVSVNPEARAQTTGSDTSTAKTDQARELMLKGNRHFEKGEWDKAYAAYIASWALKRHYSLAGNLAEVESKLGKHRDAAEHLQYYLATLPKGRDKDRQRALKQFAEARKHIATLTLVVNSSGAEVKIDGALLGKSPLEFDVFVEPGEHRIEATLDGHEPATKELNAAAGETREIVLTLRNASIPPAKLPDSGLPAPDPGKPPSNPPRTQGGQNGDAKRTDSTRTALLITGGGLAVLGVGAGVYFKVRAGSAQDDVDSLRSQATKELGGNCPTGSGASVCRDLADAAARRNSSNQVATIAFVGGGVFAVATVATYFLWQPEPKQPATRVSVSPWVGRRTNGVVLTGRF